MSNLGGVALWCGCIAALVALRIPFALFAPVFAFSTLALLAGMIDDIWWQKRSFANVAIKLSLQCILAAVAAYVMIPDPFHHLLSSLAVGTMTILVLNAINMQDGLDGLLSGIACITSLGFLVVNLFHGDTTGAAFSIILFGATLGFLTRNFPPATIFLGDSGSYFIGALLTFLLFNATKISGAITLALVPALLLLGVPIANLVFVFFRRVMAGQSPLVGDRMHGYDLINKKTGSVPKTNAYNYVAHAVFVAVGVALLV